mmetsp:Transcript_37679/g.83912  ORF Transcript_37679/g.83912 Transcript_37679/m.83912 type:complete len:81 (-) Transcript_37679:173-415(-)
MEATRKVARRLAEEGRIEITQKGQAVDPNNFKGPIRLRLKQGGSVRPQTGNVRKQDGHKVDLEHPESSTCGEKEERSTET